MSLYLSANSTMELHDTELEHVEFVWIIYAGHATIQILTQVQGVSLVRTFLKRVNGAIGAGSGQNQGVNPRTM